jgi:hypothetical protein
MTTAMPAGRDLATLTLRFKVLDDSPDWPVTEVSINGEDPFAPVAQDWRGFDPPKILGRESPLIPVPEGRRVAVYRCSCGEAGCGVIAPVIVASPDGKRVSWVDFRDYTGVFIDPVSEWVAEVEGRPWDLPDIHFDRDQYLAEVERASRDQSWETPQRRTARLLSEILRPQNPVLPPDLGFAWAEPAWSEAGVAVMFQHIPQDPQQDIRQQLLRLTSESSDPERAANEMSDRLFSTAPGRWAARFGWDPF